MMITGASRAMIYMVLFWPLSIYTDALISALVIEGKETETNAVAKIYAKLKIPSEEDLREIIQQNVGSVAYPSEETLEAIDQIHLLQEEYEAMKDNLIGSKIEYETMKQSIDASIESTLNENNTVAKESSNEDINIQDLEISNLTSIFKMTSFSSYTTEELDSSFQHASDEISTLIQMLAQTNTASYPQMLQLLRTIQESDIHEPFMCSDSGSETSTISVPEFSKEEIQKQYDEQWKHIAKYSDLLSRGRETELALQQRTDQYLVSTSSSPLSFTSPLMPKGTDAIEDKLETKMEDISNQFKNLKLNFDALKDDREAKLKDLKNMYGHSKSNADDEMSCVNDQDDVQDEISKILHEERRNEVFQYTNDTEGTVVPPPINLWWMIQSPLFFTVMDSLDTLVDFLSGHNDILDQIIDFLMDITSSATSEEEYVEDSEALLGTNLKAILKKKLHNVDVQLPKEVEPYWKKSGMLKDEVVQTFSRTVHSIPDDPLKYIEKIRVEVQVWIENIMELLQV